MNHMSGYIAGQTRTSKGKAKEAAGSKRAAGEKEVASAKAKAKEKTPGKAQVKVKEDMGKAKDVHTAWTSWVISGAAPSHGEDRSRIGADGGQRDNT